MITITETAARQIIGLIDDINRFQDQASCSAQFFRQLVTSNVLSPGVTGLKRTLEAALNTPTKEQPAPEKTISKSRKSASSESKTE